MTTITVASSLSGTVYFHWYLDGAYLGMSLEPAWTLVLERNEQARLEILDTNDADFDPVANAPAGYPARRVIVWARSVDADILRYRIDQQREAEGWETLGYVHDDAAKWTYSFLSPRLDDLAAYQWRIVPLDQAGNEGDAITLDPELIVRTPDAPDFTVSFDAGTTRVQFSAA